jgi:hypothetical protein
MARINIPRSEYGVLRDLSELSETSFSELLNGLRDVEPNINQLGVAGLLSTKVRSINPSSLKTLLRTVFSLYQMMDAKGRTAQEIAGDVKEAIEREKPKTFPIDKGGILAERMQQLLSIGGMVAITAKAISVMLEQERIFCGAMILSDIRPVFGASPDSASAALLTHTLNISFHQCGEHKEFYVALTTSELQTLKKAVDQAERESEGLKNFVQRSGVKFLTEGE